MLDIHSAQTLTLRTNHQAVWKPFRVLSTFHCTICIFIRDNKFIFLQNALLRYDNLTSGESQQHKQLENHSRACTLEWNHWRLDPVLIMDFFFPLHLQVENVYSACRDKSHCSVQSRGTATAWLMWRLRLVLTPLGKQVALTGTWNAPLWPQRFNLRYKSPACYSKLYSASPQGPKYGMCAASQQQQQMWRKKAYRRVRNKRWMTASTAAVEKIWCVNLGEEGSWSRTEVCGEK